MSEPVLDLNEEDLLRDPLHGQPERLNASNSQANQQNRDLVDTFGLFKDYLDKKLVDLKSDILSEQDNLSKKYRDEANIKFKSEGNRIQFRFNENIMDGLNKIHKDLVSVASPLSSITGDLVGKLKERNKLIRIADNSTGGWATVREYESNDIAENDEDEKKIRQAETRALKTIKEKKTRPQPYTTRPTPAVGSIATATAPPPAYDFSRYQQPFRTSTARREPCPMDICHYCKQYGHWRRNCPLNFKSATASAPSYQPSKQQ